MAVLLLAQAPPASPRSGREEGDKGIACMQGGSLPWQWLSSVRATDERWNHLLRQHIRLVIIISRSKVTLRGESRLCYL